jgi:hypothetical protein
MTCFAILILRSPGMELWRHQLLNFWYVKLLILAVLQLTSGLQNGISYNMNINIGTPFQNLSVVIDTGSSDLVVNSPSTALCGSQDCVYGAFSPNASSSFKSINGNFSSQYLIGAIAGRWGTDSVQIDGQLLQSFVLGVGDNASSLPQNILGLGFPSSTILGAARGNPRNQTTVGAMAAAGLVKSSSFSICLNNHSTGSILFGGVDTANYQGQLHTYPIVPGEGGVFDRLAVNVSGVSIGGINTTSTMRCMLDTGEPDLRLPTEYVDSIWSIFDVTPLSIGDPSLNETWGLIDCTAANSSLTANITLPGLEIAIPLRHLVMPITPSLLFTFGKSPSDIPPGKCAFNVNHKGSYSDLSILGIPFFQSTYAAFDLDSKQVGLAPLNPAPGPSDIQEIVPGGSNISLSSISPSHVSTSISTSTATAVHSGSGTSSTTSSAPSSTHPSGADSKLKTWSITAMLGLLAVIGFLQ